MIRDPEPLPPIYPPDRLRQTPTPVEGRVWAVYRTEAPGSHYVAHETNAVRARPAVATGLTRAEAEAHAYALNQARGGGPGAEIVSGGT